MTTIIHSSKRDGSHIQFFTKEQVMMCARDLIRRYINNPMSLKGIKLPSGLEIKDNSMFDHTFKVKYYGINVGEIDRHAFCITYLM